MITLEEIRVNRLAKEAAAREIAAAIGPGDYYASGNTVRMRVGGHIVATCDDHSQAVRVLIACANV